MGFPTEDSDDFLATMSVIRDGRFASGSLFKYQDRAYAPSAELNPKVPEAEKDRRFDLAVKELNSLGYEVTVKPDKLMVLKG